MMIFVLFCSMRKAFKEIDLGIEVGSGRHSRQASLLNFTVLQ
jgi:hypothetical protein